MCFVAQSAPDWASGNPFKMASRSFWHDLIIFWAFPYFLKLDVSVSFCTFLPFLQGALVPFIREWYLEIKIQGGIKMAEQEDPELTSSHGHIKTTATYRTNFSENHLKTSRIAHLQLRKLRKNQDGQEEQRHSLVRICIPSGRDINPQMGGIITTREVPSEGGGVQAPCWAL